MDKVTKCPAYNVGLFLVELPEKTWNGLDLATKEGLVAKCTLLHEYIHFIQDTATYYGMLYRNGRYNNATDGVMAPEVVGANIAETEGVNATVALEKGRMMFGDLVAGSVLLKENMAVAAQEYAFEGCGSVNIPKSDNYTAITRYVWRELPALCCRYLLTFSLYDMALCTEDPVVALLHLIDYFKTTNIDRKVRYYAEEELIGWLYDEGEACLEQKGMVDYAKIRGEVKLGNMMGRSIEDSLCTLPFEGGQVADHQQKNRLCSYFIQKSCMNLALRVNRPTVIARSLVEFKKSLDMEVLYPRFGQPYMLCIDENGNVNTNIGVIVK